MGWTTKSRSSIFVWLNIKNPWLSIVKISHGTALMLRHALTPSRKERLGWHPNHKRMEKPMGNSLTNGGFHRNYEKIIGKSWKICFFFLWGRASLRIWATWIGKMMIIWVWGAIFSDKTMIFDVGILSICGANWYNSDFQFDNGILLE